MISSLLSRVYGAFTAKKKAPKKGAECRIPKSPHRSPARLDEGGHVRGKRSFP